LLRVLKSAFGTNLPILDVGTTVVIEGKADNDADAAEAALLTPSGHGHSRR
jgi:hypothetical protein